MTPEEVALATLDVQKAQNWITGIAIIVGPLVGVLFTLWSQGRKDRQDAKHRLFLILMGGRKAELTREVVNALNTIDVVFSDSSAVRTAWQNYYRTLHGQVTEERHHCWLELLSAMATDLGYKKLKQVDIDKFYLPQGHVDDAEFQRQMGGHWKRVLENTERFVVEARKSDGAGAPQVKS